MSVPIQKNARILIIDHDPGMLSLVESLTSNYPASLAAAATLGEGVRLAAQQRFDVILLDHFLPDGNGLEKVAELIAQDRLRPILYLTAHSAAHTAIEAIKRGAFDYLPKPLEASFLKQRLLEALEYRHLTRLPVLVEAAEAADEDADVLVGHCHAMQQVYKSIGRLSLLDAPVLIEGEVGTGKEMIARAIHRYGPRHQRPFVKIASDELAMLLRRRREDDATEPPAVSLDDILPQCAGGTVLLEEPAGLSTGDQSRLLAALRQSTGRAELGVRMIVSTSVRSRQLLQQGTMRSDLYYYLSPYTVRVPALRERGDDFERLVAHFMQRLAHVAPPHECQGPPRVSPAAMELLRSHDWPGNLAQLKSVLQSVLLESPGAVLATTALRRALDGGANDRPPGAAVAKLSQDNAGSTELAARENAEAPERIGGYAEALDARWDLSAFVHRRLSGGTCELYADAVAQLEQNLLQLVLQHTRGNQAQAAKYLGITRTSLRKKIALAHIDLARLAPIE